MVEDGDKEEEKEKEKASVGVKDAPTSYFT